MYINDFSLVNVYWQPVPVSQGHRIASLRDALTSYPLSPLKGTGSIPLWRPGYQKPREIRQRRHKMKRAPHSGTQTSISLYLHFSSLPFLFTPDVSLHIMSSYLLNNGLSYSLWTSNPIPPFPHSFWFPSFSLDRKVSTNDQQKLVINIKTIISVSVDNYDNDSNHSDNYKDP